MKVVRFEINKDLDLLEAYLRDQYLENRQALSWLPQRLHDVIYSIKHFEFLCFSNKRNSMIG